MKVKDLTDECFGSTNRILLCQECGSQYSAHEGDYFLRNDEDILTCCEEPLVRGNTRTLFEES
jgi:hypothetical protein